MKTVLRLPEHALDDVLAHLLPPGGWREEAAFLMVKPERGPETLSLEFIESVKLAPNDFDTQEGDYIELNDEARARLIKRAHDLDAALVEMHCHPGPWRAAFSDADRAGLRETVPHMFWRLRNRPYLALVVAQSGFDALLWIDDPRVPRALDAVFAGDKLLRPTNASLQGWS